MYSRILYMHTNLVSFTYKFMLKSTLLKKKKRRIWFLSLNLRTRDLYMN